MAELELSPKISNEKVAELELSPKLKNFFITAFDEAIEATIIDGKFDIMSEQYRDPDILSVAEHLEAVLVRRKNELDGDDRLIFNCFLPSLRQSIRNRDLTMGFTSFVSDITDFIRYICIWLNSEKNYNIDIKVFSRRKSLTGEFKKILLKSIENVNNPELKFTPPVIRDRFGLKLILAHDDSNLLLDVTRIIVSIFTNQDSDAYLEFTNWVKTSNDKFGGEEIPRNTLLNLLNYHLEINLIKNFVSRPASSGYKAWQATFTVDATSPNFCGFMFELQTMTAEMHKNNEYGPVAHNEYKKRTQEKVKGIFEIIKYSGGLVFYEGPNYPDLDLDGLTTHASILYRHVSRHVAKRQAQT